MLRRGFPDLKFFGNTFVAMNLASEVPGGNLLSNKKGSGLDVWTDIAKREFGVNLHYQPYIKGLGTERSCEGLETLIREKLKHTNNPLAINFHFPETDMEGTIPSALPKTFGNDVAQFLHLHCSSDFYLKAEGSSINNHRRSRLQRAYESGLIKKFIAVSYSVRDSYLGVLPDEAIEVVPNGVSEKVYAFREEPDKDAFRNQFRINGKSLVGYAGRMDYVKGYQNLIGIMSWFNSRPEFDVGFIFAASGGDSLKNLKRDLKSRAPRLLEQGRIGLVLDVSKFVGGFKDINQTVYDFFQDHVDKELQPICDLYRGITPVPLQALSDLYIQPSQSEGLPLSVIEAVFVGTPTVVTRAGGMAEIISAQVGRVIDTHSKSGVMIGRFCDGMVDLLEETYGVDGEENKEAFRKEARDRLLPTYSAKVMARKVESIYRSFS